MVPRKSDDSAVSRRQIDSLAPIASREAKISKPARPTSRSRPKRRRPPGRPFKLPGRSDSSRPRSGRSECPSASPSVAPIPSPTPPRRTLSMLEALPVEIIEQIFFNCLNLNLPRASPVLATALSREHLYKLLINLAFWDDPIRDGQDPSSEVVQRVFAPLEYVPLTLERRRELQEQIFRCKWCTMKRIQDQIPQIMDLTIHRRWVDVHFVTMERDQKEAPDRLMSRVDNKTTRVFHGKPRNVDSELECELHVRPNELVEVRTNLTGWGPTTRPALGLLTFPTHLLRGRSTSFTEEDVLFLEMLRMCSFHYLKIWDYPASKARIDREALHEGVQKAIRTQNLDAVATLLKIDEFVYRFSPVFKSERGRPFRPFYAIPSHHFITATQHGRDNPVRSVAIFELLTRASAESIPPDAREITEWIIHISEETARRGLEYPDVNTRLLHWLSDFILRLPAHRDKVVREEAAQIFDCGGVLRHRLRHGQSQDEYVYEARLFVDQVLMPERDELCDYMSESPYRPADFCCV